MIIAAQIGLYKLCLSLCSTLHRTALVPSALYAAQGFAFGSRRMIARRSTATERLKKQNPCPATNKTYGSCPGDIIDHVVPLKRGGPDAPTNMQLRTKEAAREKDKWE